MACYRDEQDQLYWDEVEDVLLSRFEFSKDKLGTGKSERIASPGRESRRRIRQCAAW